MFYIILFVYRCIGGEMMIFEKMRVLISEQFSVSEDSLTLDTLFEEDLNADSLDFVELAMAIEEEFDLESQLDEQAIEEIKTIGDAVDMIRELIG